MSRKNKEQLNKIAYGFGIALVVILLAFLAYPKVFAKQILKKEVSEVQTLVQTFGQRLQNVALTNVEEDELSLNIEKNYGDLVTSPILLVKWLANPENAPGKYVPNVIPESIEIISTEKLNETTYEVKGEIIEIYPADDVNEKEIADKKPITILLEKVDKNWLIADFILEKNENEVE
ncbi:MAG: hypothetical protein WC070_01135 [Candidatus Magasanikbacteria bacterium]